MINDYNYLNVTFLSSNSFVGDFYFMYLSLEIIYTFKTNKFSCSFYRHDLRPPNVNATKSQKHFFYDFYW